MTHRAYTCKNAGKSHLVQKIESVNNRTDTVARSLITVLLCRSLVLLFSVAIRYVFPVFWMDGFKYCLLITARNGWCDQAYTQSYSTGVSTDLTPRCILRLAHQGRHRMGAKSGVYDCTVPDCASAGTSLSIVLCLSLSQVGVLSKRMKDSGWLLAWELTSAYPALWYRPREIQVPSNSNGTSLSNLAANSGLTKFRHGISIVEACYQLGSRKADAQSAINWTVVGQLSW